MDGGGGRRRRNGRKKKGRMRRKEGPLWDQNRCTGMMLARLKEKKKEWMWSSGEAKSLSEGIIQARQRWHRVKEETDYIRKGAEKRQGNIEMHRWCSTFRPSTHTHAHARMVEAHTNLVDLSVGAIADHFHQLENPSWILYVNTHREKRTII